jgi:hypothetical protein
MTPEISRREALQWLASASVLMAADPGALAAESGAIPGTPGGKPYGTDPNLLKSYKPGELWPLTFSEGQRRTATALVDLILPADDRSPAASTVGVPAFIDEWISAPYATQQADRPVLLDGLQWLEAESQKRFQADFTALTEAQQSQIADTICHLPSAKPGFETAAKFFHLFRNLTLGGYYTSPVGIKDVGFIGNVARTRFDGPPPEVLAKLGIGKP